MNKLEEAFEQNDLGIPVHLLGGLRRYVLEKTPTGGFLRHVLEGDLFGAAVHADPVSRPEIGTIAHFIQWYFPACSFGSPYTVSQWLKEGKDDDPGPDQETSGEAGCDKPPPGPEVAKEGDHPQVNRPQDPDWWIGEDPGNIRRFVEGIGSGNPRPEVGEFLLGAMTNLWETWEEGRRMILAADRDQTDKIAAKMEEVIAAIGKLSALSRDFLDRKGLFA